jgi:hypothetical protein
MMESGYDYLFAKPSLENKPSVLTLTLCVLLSGQPRFHFLTFSNAAVYLLLTCMPACRWLFEDYMGSGLNTVLLFAPAVDPRVSVKAKLGAGQAGGRYHNLEFKHLDILILLY